MQSTAFSLLSLVCAAATGKVSGHGAADIWRSGGAQSAPEEVDVPAVACLCYDALCKWHSGESASSRATIEEAISLEKGLNDMHGLAVALHFAAVLAQMERKPAEVER